MALQYSTPGVYIEELDAFPHSIVAVPTAIPAFIGYTQKATDENGNPLKGIPYMIQSQSDYETYFGKGFNSVFDPASSMAPDKRFYLYDSIRLFYANGGGQCYIVSVGAYGATPVPTVAPTDLTGPLDINTGALLKVEDATLIVIPDAVSLTEQQAYNTVYTAVLTHCNFMQSRMGIFDLVKPKDNVDNTLNTAITTFRGGIGNNFLNYGAAYFPWLASDIVPDNEINFTNLKVPLTPADFIKNFGDSSNPLSTVNSNISAIVTNYTTAQGSLTQAQGGLTQAQTAYNNAIAASPQVVATVTSTKAALVLAQSTFDAASTTLSSVERATHLGLMAISPAYNQLITQVSTGMNLLPPSGAIAGIYTAVDNSRGVWKAPANWSINSVNAPSATFNRNMTDNLNVDAVTGKSINAIRSFPGIGTMVFGGRTLDGNSQDWRYINVRRTLIMMEQSIKLALRAYVFEPNDDNTWTTVKSMIANFLTNLWKQGALAGSKPEDAFQVTCGLNVTMTPQDILDGYMRVTVKVAVVHPAEFIVLTFQQELQTS